MRKRTWKHKLDSGKALRQAINEDDNKATLKALMACYKEIHKLIPYQYDENDLDNDCEEIYNQLDNCDNYVAYEMTEEELQEEINYLLKQFYDLCDDNGIWVEL